MPGLDPGIHSVTSQRVEAAEAWIAGSSPAMTMRNRHSVISPLDEREVMSSEGCGRQAAASIVKGSLSAPRCGDMLAPSSLTASSAGSV
jgi:hypothetical protein